MSTEVNMPVLRAVASIPEKPAVKPSQNVDSAPAVQELKLPGQGATESQSEILNSKEVENVVSDLNDVVQNLQRDLLFSIDEKSGKPFIKVLDKETEEVIREIPSKDIRELKARLGEMAGLIIRDKG